MEMDGSHIHGSQIRSRAVIGMGRQTVEQSVEFM
jgi:carbonic anhydrase/acetyltransferase-like protein (isoleucine patch superfamily)